jgi:hypothetical protein
MGQLVGLNTLSWGGVSKALFTGWVVTPSARQFNDECG